MKIIGITGGVGSGKTALLHYIGEHYNCRIILADEASHAVMAPGGSIYGPLVELLTRQMEKDQAGQGSRDVQDKGTVPLPLLNQDGTINHNVMAGLIFSHKELLEKVNALIHPAVRQYIMEAIAEERRLSASKGAIQKHCDAGVGDRSFRADSPVRADDVAVQNIDAGADMDASKRKAHDYLFIEAALLIEEGYKAVVDELWFVYSSPDVRRQRLAASRGYSDEKIDRIMQAQLSDEEFLRNADVVIDNSGSLENACAQVDQRLQQGRL